MENSTPCKYKTVKDIVTKNDDDDDENENNSEYIITSRSRVVVQKFTEIRSPILGGQIGEVLVFYVRQLC